MNIETIRYYERVKVLAPPPRSANGRRVYGPAQTRTLAFIRRSRGLGFTLDEIRTLLTLSADGGKGVCAEASSLAARHLAEVRAKIADLRAMEKALAGAVRRCEAGEAPGCPVIDTLWRLAPESKGLEKSLRRY